MEFIKTLVQFAVVINKRKQVSITNNNAPFFSELLVKDEADVENMKPGLEYLDDAINKLPAFLLKKEQELPHRVNKDDLVKLFEDGGFFRSYSLRLAVAGRESFQ